MTNSRPCRCRRLMRNRRKLTQASRMPQSRLPNRLTCRAVLRISRRPPCLLQTMALRRDPQLRRTIRRIMLPQRVNVPWSTVPAQDAPTQQYRPAPEYGAYGPVPTQPAGGTAAANDTANGAPNMPPQPQYGAYGQASGQQPQRPRNPFFGNPYVGGNQQNDQQNTQSNNGNPFMKPAAQGGANVPPAAQYSPITATRLGIRITVIRSVPRQQNGAATKPKSSRIPA